MIDIRIVYSLCFLFAATIFNGLTIIYITRLKLGATKKKNLFALASILFFHSLYVFIVILVWSDCKFVDFGAPFATLYGPLLWHLTQLSRKKNYPLHKLKWHLIPFITFTVGYIYSLTHTNEEAFIRKYTNLLYHTAEIQFAIYLILSIIIMKRIKSTDEEIYQAKTTFFNYLYLLSTIAIFLFLTVTFDRFFIFEDQPQKEFWSYTIHLLILGISILFHLGIVKEWQIIGFKNALEPLENQIEQKELTLEKYKSTRNKRSYLANIAEKIQEVPNKIFRNPKLSLSEFAEIIGEEPYLITQTFSIELNTNFNKYTNQKRLEFSTHLLLSQSYSELAIADIAFQSGFNSEASFYRAFRAEFKTTPRKFQQANQ